MSAQAQPAQVAITLPDGSVRHYDTPTTGTMVAASIGAGLAKAALAVKVDGELRDLKREMARAELTIPAFQVIGGDQS